MWIAVMKWVGKVVDGNQKMPDNFLITQIVNVIINTCE